MKLVWLVDPSTLCEASWIRYLLSSLQYEEVLELDLENVYENACIVFNYTVAYEEYLSIYDEERLPFGAIHLSDYTLTDSCNFLQLDACKFVFRNYYHPEFSHHSKVKTIGLGYNANDQKNREDIYHIQPWYHWCFWGIIDCKDQLDALRAFENVRPYLLLTSETNVEQQHYQRMAECSKFGICPLRHYSIETPQFYEILEAGSIPIVLNKNPAQTCYQNIDSYWHALFGIENENVPWIHGDTWDDCVSKVHSVLANPDEYHSMRASAQVFWQQYKKKMSLSICSKMQLLTTF